MKEKEWKGRLVRQEDLMLYLHWEHFSTEQRKDESSETSLCDLYNQPEKLNLAGHIWF